MTDLKVTYSPQKVRVSANPADLGVTIEPPIARSYIPREPYPGPYTITPGDETQIIPINGLRATQDIVINPVPSTYGRIAYNGGYLTVY